MKKLATLPTSFAGENGWVGLAAEGWAKDQYNHGKKWMFWSIGPDLQHDFYWSVAEYDPTNGTVSVGDIIRTGP